MTSNATITHCRPTQGTEETQRINSHMTSNAIKVRQPALFSPTRWLQNTTNQGPYTKPHKTIGATIHNESTNNRTTALERTLFNLLY